jgi:hypothetical protein
MIWNWDHFLFILNCIEFAHFYKLVFIQLWLTRKMWYIETNINIFNNRLRKYFIFYEKNVYDHKETQS